MKVKYITRAERIERARKLLKPSPVKACRVPTWLRSRLLKLKKEGKFHSYSNCGENMLKDAMAAINVPSSALDNWGSTNWYDEEVLVTEPYSPNILHMSRLAHFLGVRCQGSGNSWHDPGYTSRILFVPSLPKRKIK